MVQYIRRMLYFSKVNKFSRTPLMGRQRTLSEYSKAEQSIVASLLLLWAQMVASTNLARFDVQCLLSWNIALPVHLNTSLIH